MKTGTMIKAKFAAMNKNETLHEYKEDCKREQTEIEQWECGSTEYPRTETFKRTNWRLEACKVEQYFKVTAKEWEDITNNLLDGNILYREKGGTIYTGKDKNFDYDLIYKNEAMLKDFQENNAHLVTIIEHEETGERIAIDPQGYAYARYVGVDIELITNQKKAA